MIFLRRFKKYLTKRLDGNIKFYTATSYGIIISDLLYGCAINNGEQIEYFKNVVCDIHRKFWCVHDSTIIEDIITYSCNGIRIHKTKKMEHFHIELDESYGIYYGCPGFYHFVGKTLYRYYYGFDNDVIMEIFIVKIRD